MRSVSLNSTTVYINEGSHIAIPQEGQRGLVLPETPQMLHRNHIQLETCHKNPAHMWFMAPTYPWNPDQSSYTLVGEPGICATLLLSFERP